MSRPRRVEPVAERKPLGGAEASAGIAVWRSWGCIGFLLPTAVERKPEADIVVAADRPIAMALVCTAFPQTMALLGVATRAAVEHHPLSRAWTLQVRVWATDS